jgi:glycosyltransferase involved in cell wall biosynthesis
MCLGAEVPSKLAGKKVAIVCDWLTSIGGAERVVLALHELFPDAPIYTSQYDPNQIDWFNDANVKTTWLQGLPKQSTIRRLLPVLRRQAFQNLDLSDYDIVISSSGAEAKAVKKLKKGALHITYCHSPTHYYWARYDEYLKEPGFGMLNPLARNGLRILGGPMRKWDYKVAQRPDILIANSTHIQNKISEYYDRESVVIFPPVDIERFTQKTQPKRSGLVVSGRQVPYKRFDLAIQAAIKLDLQLTVNGDGPMHEKLLALAHGHKNIIFTTGLSDKEMPKLIAGAELFLFPGVEDFGIAPVEALAAGTPVVAFGEGGSLDYINDDTGILFNSQTVDSLADAISVALGTKWDHTKIAKSAQKFNKQAFEEQIAHLVESNIS